MIFTAILNYFGNYGEERDTRSPSTCLRVPWFTEECWMPQHDRKKSQRLAFHHPTLENVLTFKRS